MFNELVIATHNQGKLTEIAALIVPLGIHAYSAAELGLPEPEENGDSFEANAAIKSESACRLSGKTSLADDSGLAVEALGGAPGIYSARWAEENKDFSPAIQRVKAELEKIGHTDAARASFICVLSLSAPSMPTLFFRGEIHGQLTFPARGIHGFGYDPIFIPDGYTQTFGEMTPQLKHEISHRAIAFSLFLNYLQKARTST